tara:strand:- start:2524 stop:2829 length:306 start_codon:yes stop_codon:yes gene_type:complete
MDDEWADFDEDDDEWLDSMLGKDGDDDDDDMGVCKIENDVNLCMLVLFWLNCSCWREFLATDFKILFILLYFSIPSQSGPFERKVGVWASLHSKNISVKEG